MSGRPAAFLLAASLFCLADCGGRDSEALKREYLARGREYAAKGNHHAAIIEYRNALKQDPRFGEARYQLAEAYAATQQLPRALKEYIRAADLVPEHIDAHIKAGNLLLVARRFDEAKARARVVLQKNPNSLPGLLLLGHGLAGLEALDDAVRVTERAVQLDPTRPGPYTNLGVLELSRGNQADAEAAFTKATQVDPRSVGAHLALATFYRAVGQTAGAGAALNKAWELDRRNLIVNYALASFYMESNRAREAERYFRAAADIAGSADALLALADYYIRTDRRDAGLPILERLATDVRAQSAARVRIAALEYLAGRKPRSFQLLDQVLLREPQHVAALVLKARLQLAEERLNDAMRLLRDAITADARSAPAHFVLGQTHAARNDLEAARRSFNEALRLKPDAVDAMLELARLHLKRDEVETSIAFAQQGVRQRPGSVEARLALVRSLMARRDDWPRAGEQLRTLVATHPASAEAHAAMGALCVSTSDQDCARRSFQRALQLDGKHLQALSGLVALDLAGKQVAQALSRIQARLAATPDNPDVLILAAKVYAAIGDAPRAEATLRRVLHVNPSGVEAYTLLGQLYVATKRIDDAKRQFGELATRSPESAAALTMMGLLFHSEQNVTEAERWYEKAVRIDPRAAAAANNLAWIYANRGRNLDVALQLAQSAKAQLPREAEINDTLGFIYYKKDLPELAIPVLLQSIEADPGNPLSHYHLGLVYARQGEDAKARRLLERALKLKPDFARAAEAKQALASLVY